MEESSNKSALLERGKDISVGSGGQAAGSEILEDAQHCPTTASTKNDHRSPTEKETAIIAPVSDYHEGEQEETPSAKIRERINSDSDLQGDNSEKGGGDADSEKRAQECIEAQKQRAYTEVFKSIKICGTEAMRMPSGQTSEPSQTGKLPLESGTRGPMLFSVETKTHRDRESSCPDVEITGFSVMPRLRQVTANRTVEEKQRETSSAHSDASDGMRGEVGEEEEEGGAGRLAPKEDRCAMGIWSGTDVQPTGAGRSQLGKRTSEHDSTSSEGLTPETSEKVESTLAVIEKVDPSKKEKVQSESDTGSKLATEKEDMNEVLILSDVDDGQTEADSLQHVNPTDETIVSGSKNDTDPSPTSADKTIVEGVVSMPGLSEKCNAADSLGLSEVQSVGPTNSAFRTLQKLVEAHAHKEKTAENVGSSLIQADSAPGGVGAASAQKQDKSPGSVDGTKEHTQNKGDDNYKCLESAGSLLVQSVPASGKDNPVIYSCPGTLAPAADLARTRGRAQGRGSGQRLTGEAASDESLDIVTFEPGSETTSVISLEGDEKDVAGCALASKSEERAEQVGSDTAGVEDMRQSVRRGPSASDMRQCGRRSDNEEGKTKEITHGSKDNTRFSSPSAFEALQKLAEDHAVQRGSVTTPKDSGISTIIGALSDDLETAADILAGAAHKTQEMPHGASGGVDVDHSSTVRTENTISVSKEESLVPAACALSMEVSNCVTKNANSVNTNLGQDTDTEMKTSVFDVGVVVETMSKLSEEKEQKEGKPHGCMSETSTMENMEKVKSKTSAVIEIKSDCMKNIKFTSDSVKDMKSTSDSVTNEKSVAENSPSESSKDVRLALRQKVIKIVSSSEKQENTSADKKSPRSLQDSTVTQSVLKGNDSDSSSQTLLLPGRKNLSSNVLFRPMSSNSRSLLMSAAAASSVSSPVAGSAPASASSSSSTPVSSSTPSPQQTVKSQLTPVLMGSHIYLMPSSSVYTFPTSNLIRVPKNKNAKGTGTPVDLTRAHKQGQTTPRPEFIKLKRSQALGEVVSNSNTTSKEADSSDWTTSKQSTTEDSGDSGIKIMDVRSLAPVTPVKLDASPPATSSTNVSARVTSVTITTSINATVPSPVTSETSAIDLTVSRPMISSVVSAPVTSVAQSCAVTTASSGVTFAPGQAAVNTLMPGGGKRTILLTKSGVSAGGIGSEGARLVPLARIPSPVTMTKSSGSVAPLAVTPTMSMPAQHRVIKPIPAASIPVSNVPSLTPKAFFTMKQSLTSSTDKPASVVPGPVSCSASCHLTTPIYLLTSTCASASPPCVTPSVKGQNRILLLDHNNKLKSHPTIVTSTAKFSSHGPDLGAQVVKLSQTLDRLPRSSASIIHTAPTHTQHVSLLSTSFLRPATATSTSQSLLLTSSATKSLLLTSPFPQSTSVTPVSVHGGIMTCVTKGNSSKMETVETSESTRARLDATDSSSASLLLPVITPAPPVPFSNWTVAGASRVASSFVSSMTSDSAASSSLSCKKIPAVPVDLQTSPKKSKIPQTRTVISNALFSGAKLKSRREGIRAESCFDSVMVADTHGGDREVEVLETSRNSRKKAQPLPKPIVVDAGAVLARESSSSPTKRPRILTSLLQSPFLEDAKKKSMTTKKRKKKKMVKKKSSPKVYSTTLQTAQGSVPVMVMNPTLQDSDSNSDSEDNDACDVSLLASQADMDMSLLTKMVMESEGGSREELQQVNTTDHVLISDEKPDSKEVESEMACPTVSVQPFTEATAEMMSQNEEKSTSVSESVPEDSVLECEVGEGDNSTVVGEGDNSTVVGEGDDSGMSSQAGVICGNEESETPAGDDGGELGLKIESVFSIADLASSAVSETENNSKSTPEESQTMESERVKKAKRLTRFLRNRPMPKCEKDKRMSRSSETSSVVQKLESAHNAYFNKDRHEDSTEQFLPEEKCEGTEQQKLLLRFNLHESSEWKRACTPCYVVVERISQTEVAAKGRGSTSSKCSDHCRKRTLNCLCGLNLLACENHPDVTSLLATGRKAAAKLLALSKVTLKTPPPPCVKEELAPGDEDGSPGLSLSVETVSSPTPKLQLSPKSPLLKLPSKTAKAKQQLSPVQCFQRDIRQLQKQVNSKRREMKQKKKKKKQALSASAAKQSSAPARRVPKKRKPTQPTINGVPVDPLSLLSHPTLFCTKAPSEGEKQTPFASKTPLAGRRPLLGTDPVEAEICSSVTHSPKAVSESMAEKITTAGDAKNPPTKRSALPMASEAKKQKLQASAEPNPTTLVHALPSHAKPIPAAKIEAALKSLTKYVSATGRASSLQKGIFLLQIDGTPVLVTTPGPGNEGKPVKAVVLQNTMPGTLRASTSGTVQNVKSVPTQAVAPRTLTLTTVQSAGASSDSLKRKLGSTNARVVKPHVSQPVRLVTQVFVNSSSTLTTSRAGSLPVTPASQKPGLSKQILTGVPVLQPPNVSRAVSVSKTVHSSTLAQGLLGAAQRLSRSSTPAQLISTSTSTIATPFGPRPTLHHASIHSPMYPALTTAHSVSRTRAGPPQMGPNNVQEIRVYPQSQRSMTLIDNARRRSQPVGVPLPNGAPPAGSGPSDSGVTTMRVYGDRSSVLGHLPIDSKLLPQRKSKRESSPLTEQQRKAKRQKLEKKYPLPPGVVIKSEPDDSSYELDSGWSVTSELHSSLTSQGTSQPEPSSWDRTTRAAADMNSEPEALPDIPEEGNLPRLSPAPFASDEPPSLTQEAPFPVASSPDASFREDADLDLPPILQPMAPHTASSLSGVDKDAEDNEPLMAAEPATVSPRPSSLTPSASTSCSSLGLSSSSSASPRLPLPPSSKNLKIQRLKELLKKKEQQLENVKKHFSVLGTP